MMRRIAAAALLVVLPVITAGAQDGRESSDSLTKPNIAAAVVAC